MTEYVDKDAAIDKTEAFCDVFVTNWTDEKVLSWIRKLPTVEVATVVPGLYIVSGDKLPPNPWGALTLSTEYIGKHENGWEIVADVHEDYYEWVNAFVAYNHGYPNDFVAGDFEEVVVASSKKAYEEFLSFFPPDAWDYGDI